MNTIDILFFGQAAEIAGKSRMTLKGIHETESLKEKLISQFPELKNIQFALAVDKKLISENTPLDERCTVAILPPFSGG